MSQHSRLTLLSDLFPKQILNAEKITCDGMRTSKDIPRQRTTCMAGWITTRHQICSYRIHYAEIVRGHSTLPWRFEEVKDSIPIVKIKKCNLPFKPCILITYCCGTSLKIGHEHCFLGSCILQ